MKADFGYSRDDAGNADWVPAGSGNRPGWGEPPAKFYPVELGIDTSGGFVAFTFTGGKDCPVVGHDDDDGYFLAIPEGVYVGLEITLSGKWHWQFDKDPISFKDASAAQFYHLAAQTPGKVTLWARSTVPAPQPGHPGPVQVHEFNLFVKIAQTAKRSFPVRIDPDLKNPPPPPGRKGHGGGSGHGRGHARD